VQVCVCVWKRNAIKKEQKIYQLQDARVVFIIFVCVFVLFCACCELKKKRNQKRSRSTVACSFVVFFFIILRVSVSVFVCLWRGVKIYLTREIQILCLKNNQIIGAKLCTTPCKKREIMKFFPQTAKNKCK